MSRGQVHLNAGADRILSAGSDLPMVRFATSHLNHVRRKGAMNWPLAILALLLGVLSLAILKLANVSHLDTSAEAVHVMGKLRDALQRCEPRKRQVNLEAPAPMPAAPVPMPEATPLFDGARLANDLDAPAPTPAFDDARRRTIILDARPHSVALVPQEVREREAARRECGHEAQRFGKAAALWCAGL